MRKISEWFSRTIFQSARVVPPNEHQTDDEILSSGLAHYRWGSATIRFSLGAGVGSYSPAEVAADVMTRQATWDSEVRIRQTVAYLHELVHYFQDLSSGIGNWDFTRRVIAVERLMPDLVSRYDAPNAVPTDEGIRAMQDAVSTSIYNGWPEVDRTRQHSVLVNIARTNGWEPAEELASLFSIESIFETEAVLQTVVTLSRAEFTETARQLFHDNISIVDPLEMPEKYSGLCTFILRHTMHLMGAKDSRELLSMLDKSGMNVAYLYHHYIFLIDLCCAHPPDGFFEHDDNGLELDDFLPGVRLMRYMRAMQEMPDDGQPFDPRRYERRLNEACKLSYPCIDDVYLMWKQHFDERPTDDASKTRAEIAGARINSLDAFAKIANGVAAIGVPINYSIDGHSGTYTLKLNKHKWKHDFPDMQAASYWNTALFGCVKAFYLKRSFSCPLAALCPVRQPACVSGLSIPHEIPRSDQCAVNEYFQREKLIQTQGASDAANVDGR